MILTTYKKTIDNSNISSTNLKFCHFNHLHVLLSSTRSIRVMGVNVPIFQVHISPKVLHIAAQLCSQLQKRYERRNIPQSVKFTDLCKPGHRLIWNLEWSFGIARKSIGLLVLALAMGNIYHIKWIALCDVKDFMQLSYQLVVFEPLSEKKSLAQRPSDTIVTRHEDCSS